VNLVGHLVGIIAIAVWLYDDKFIAAISYAGSLRRNEKGEMTMSDTVYALKKLAPVIVDVHQHLGHCRVFDYDFSENDLIRNMDKKGIDAAIVQPFPGAYPQAPVTIHNRIAAMSEKYPKRIFGMCSINPHVMDRGEWCAEVERCVKQLGFVGVKLHTIGHALQPPSHDGMMVFETANELNIPVMVHTGLGGQMSSPAMLIPGARKWPGLPIILAHSGFPTQAPDAVYVASLLENLYLEWSWSMAGDLAWGINELGEQRSMFGSDIINNTLTELVKAEEAGLTSEQLEWYLGKSAIHVFRLPL
jgi:predicted TIM-barrel fold metal-dependent hydrolase